MESIAAVSLGVLHRRICVMQQFFRACYLLQQSQDQESSGNDFHFNLPANKNIIASTLNITPETFSRVLHNLSGAGLVAVKGKDVHILDVEKLRAYDE